MNLELTDDQVMIRDLVHKLAQREIAPRAAGYDRSGEFPWESIKALAGQGFMGMLAPAEYGGGELDQISYCLAIEEIARACASTAVITSVQNSLLEYGLKLFGNPDQKERYLPRLAAGEIIGSYALTEPGAGSDAGSLITSARKEREYYVLNGNKLFTTSSTVAALFLVFATLDREQGKDAITAFLVDRESPGFAVGKRQEMLGMRASGTSELILDDCRVPAINRLGEEGQGFKIAMITLDSGRLGIAAQALGIARASLEASLRYARQRSQFGKPIAEFQLIQELLAVTAVEVDAAALLLYRAAALKDAGRPFSREASMAKWYASEMAARAAGVAVQVHGGYGYSTDFPVERYFRDARVTQIYEGTSEIQKLIIARHLLRE